MVIFMVFSQTEPLWGSAEVSFNRLKLVDTGAPVQGFDPPTD